MRGHYAVLGKIIKMMPQGYLSSWFTLTMQGVTETLATSDENWVGPRSKFRHVLEICSSLITIPAIGSSKYGNECLADHSKEYLVTVPISKSEAAFYATRKKITRNRLVRRTHRGADTSGFPFQAILPGPSMLEKLLGSTNDTTMACAIKDLSSALFLPLTPPRSKLPGSRPKCTVQQ
jgi:hypothetical protein